MSHLILKSESSSQAEPLRGAMRHHRLTFRAAVPCCLDCGGTIETAVMWTTNPCPGAPSSPPPDPKPCDSATTEQESELLLRGAVTTVGG